MEFEAQKNRLDYLMGVLNINASQLSAVAGADHSLITKWRRGERKLTEKSTLLRPVAEALIRLDEGNVLREIIEPYKRPGKSDVDALSAFIVSKEIDGHIPRSAPPIRQVSGSYAVTHHVYLGEEGLRTAAAAMFDFTETLPENQEIVLLFKTDFDWVAEKMTYIFALLEDVRKVSDRGTKITLLLRKEYTADKIHAFAGPWLVWHMRGDVRVFYYPPEESGREKVVASIRDYWAVRLYEDEEVEDNMYIAMYTDVLNIRSAAEECDRYLAVAQPNARYNYFNLPDSWKHQPDVNGDFIGVMRVPGLGIATREEYEAAGGDKRFPAEYFWQESVLSEQECKIVLCREDLIEALSMDSREHEAFSVMAKKPVRIPREAVVKQLERLLACMGENEDLEVAIVPRAAYERIEIETVMWGSKTMVAWLPDGSGSIYSVDQATNGAMVGFVEHVWSCLMSGWKKRSVIRKQVRNWIGGEGLDEIPEDSRYIKNWDYKPKL